MFGIGGGELFFIILVVLMLFGSDKIPEIARALGKGMAQLKNATNDIKQEIHRSADVEGLKKTFTEIGEDNVVKSITEEVHKVKQEMDQDIQKSVDVKVDIEELSGPIKRQR
jgi:sec-independent protein translocase protein TatA